MFIWTTLLDVIEYKTVAVDVIIFPFIYESAIAPYANVTVKVLKVLSELFINYESKNLINLTFFGNMQISKFEVIRRVKSNIRKQRYFRRLFKAKNRSCCSIWLRIWHSFTKVCSNLICEITGFKLIKRTRLESLRSRKILIVSLIREYWGISNSISNKRL